MLGIANRWKVGKNIMVNWLLQELLFIDKCMVIFIIKRSSDGTNMKTCRIAKGQTLAESETAIPLGSKEVETRLIHFLTKTFQFAIERRVIMEGNGSHLGCLAILILDLNYLK